MAGATITLNVDQLPDDLTGQQLRQLRAHFNQTQTQFAVTMGVNLQTIGRWERGEFAVPGSARQLLKVLLGLQPAMEMLYSSGQREKSK